MGFITNFGTAPSQQLTQALMASEALVRPEVDYRIKCLSDHTYADKIVAAAKANGLRLIVAL